MTSDTDDDQDDLPEEAQALPAGMKNYMTPKGHARLKAEFDHLTKVERPAVVEVVSWAAGNGDRSENGDYIYGKKKLREIDRRTRFLIKRLEDAEVVNPKRQTNRDQIFFGATVTYADSRGEPRTVRIIGVDEAPHEPDAVSLVSPIARALMKAWEGDIVKLRTPTGIEEIEVLEIAYSED